MKIKIISIFVLIAILFTSCKSSDKINEEEVASQVSRPFTSGAHIIYDDLEGFAQLSNDVENGLEIYFTSPEELKDIKFTLVESKIIVDYNKLSFTLDNETPLGSAAVTMILKVLNQSANEKNINVSIEGSALIIKGEIETGTFYLSIDRKTGNFLKLEIPDKNFLMEFSNFKIVG